MNNTFFLLILAIMLASCGGGSSSSDVNGTDEIEQFSFDPPRRVTSFGPDKEVIEPTLSIIINLNDNLSANDSRNYEIIIDVTTDGVFDDSDDFRIYLPTDDDIHIRRGNAFYYTDVEKGRNNINGNIQFIIHYYGLFTRDEYNNIVAGNFEYSIHTLYYDSLNRDTRTLQSEDYYPDNSVFTNALGLQTDTTRDYGAVSSEADIINVNVSLNL